MTSGSDSELQVPLIEEVFVSIVEERMIDQLSSRVTKAFPDLRFSKVVLEEGGGDHRLLILDDQLVFRFPREGRHDLRLEIRLLNALRQRCSLPIPHYVYVHPTVNFAGYHLISGTQLTSRRFAALGHPAQAAVLDEAAEFLSAMHGLAPSAIAAQEAWPHIWSAAQFADYGRKENLPIIAHHLPKSVPALESFYRLYELDQAPCDVVLHGDLVGDHILLADDENGLAGMIDFGDIALGDPAQDLLGFWSYGVGAVKHIVERYCFSAGDPGLLRRSHNHYIRYTVQRLAEELKISGSSCSKTMGRKFEDLLMNACALT
jgi:aminoglycoside phosphotransferase (APT) family kinase protein